MDKRLLAQLNDADVMLWRETERDAMAPLDEDGVSELHNRIRRARDKYTGQYRREASARVAETGGRGKARAANSRNAARAEVFEEALNRVSRRLAVLSRQSAADLRDGAAGRRQGQPDGRTRSGRHKEPSGGQGQARVHRKTTGGQKRDALNPLRRRSATGGAGCALNHRHTARARSRSVGGGRTRLLVGT